MKIVRYPLFKGATHNQPKLIVVHTMGEFIEYQNGEHLHATQFLSKIGLSAHRLLSPSGDMIKCREDTQGAYHAKGHNKDSLGLEILMAGVYDYAEFLEALKTPYLTPLQFDNAVYIVKSWMDKWNIDKEEVKRHSDIDPTRKKDPGDGFPWGDFINEL